MEKSEELLISSLRNLGLDIPAQITSIKHLDSSSLFSISSQSLHFLLHNTNTSSLPTSLPDLTEEKEKSCTLMATFLQHLGYPSEVSFHQFLYPSEEDLYKLIRFLLERLSKLSEAGKTVGNERPAPDTMETNAQPNSMTLPEKTAEPSVYWNNQKAASGLQNVRSEGGAPLSSSNSAEVPVVEDNLVYKKLVEVATNGRIGKEETVEYTENCKPEMESVSVEESLLKLRCKVESICGQEKAHLEKATGEDLALHHLKEEHEFFREAMRMALDNEHSFSFYIEQLNEQIATRKQSLQDWENQWDIDRKSLEEKKWNLMESLCVDRLDCQHQLQKLKEIDREVHSVLSEIRQREVECAKLAVDLEKQPKVETRISYIQRITEITKNSRKLDMDIERILKETRELKLESNSIEERLHRTYLVVDETIFREAKKDPVGRQAYRLLTNIHENFEKIREQILAANKVQREVAELEVKLLAIASRSLDEGKLQADLDAMRRENEHLEKSLLNYKVDTS